MLAEHPRVANSNQVAAWLLEARLPGA